MKSSNSSLMALLAFLSISFSPRDSSAASAKLIDNSPADRAVITLPNYSVSPPGKWTIVVSGEKAIRFQSTDGVQHMQAGVVALHPKANQSEDAAFRDYVENRRQLERENIENKALVSDSVNYTSSERGSMASWCIIDPATSSAHLTAILEAKRKLLVLSYDVDKATEQEFRAHAAQVVDSMTIR